ncbi:MAG TPA: GH3 auxin-responsive promoter family protein [Thermoguttaceae bacterium]|nr:GH3 auxin-responsive promoter family protein [Thermoguttaceae bacterium]
MPTTSSGLYRYDIHDVVRCVGFEGACPVLDFLNNGAHSRAWPAKNSANPRWPPRWARRLPSRASR